MIVRLIMIVMILASTSSQADNWDTSRADSHAPIFVMGDHTHKKGELMFSYRAMLMQMDENLKGQDNISNDVIFEDGFMMAPEKMTMIMHMLGFMYANSDHITWMLMIPYLDNQMDMLMKMHSTVMHQEHLMTKKESASGLSDIKASALLNLIDNESERAHITVGMNIPTGSISEKTKNETVLAYPMQLGSGTWDILAGITWHRQFIEFSYGTQLTATMRTGKNQHDYRLGNQYHIKSWIAKPFGNKLSASFSLDYTHTGTIKGKDKRIPIMMSPAARPDLQGGDLIQAGLGINLQLPLGNRLAVGYQKPIYQDLNGPQMSLQHTITLGWQLTL